MRENATIKKSTLLRFGLLAGFRIILWKGEEIVSRILFARLPKPAVHRMRSAGYPFPASKWSLAAGRPCCMALKDGRLEISAQAAIRSAFIELI